MHFLLLKRVTFWPGQLFRGFEGGVLKKNWDFTCPIVQLHTVQGRNQVFLGKCKIFAQRTISNCKTPRHVLDILRMLIAEALCKDPSIAIIFCKILVNFVFLRPRSAHFLSREKLLKNRTLYLFSFHALAKGTTVLRWFFRGQTNCEPDRLKI